MSSVLATARAALHDAIESWRDNPPDVDEVGYDPDVDGAPYVVTSFELVQTYLPRVTLQELGQSARVSVVGLGADEDRLSRSRRYQLDQPVQVGMQVKIDPEDNDAIDEYVTFFEQLRRTARLLDVDNYRWLRTEALRDQNRTPYDFVRLREQHTLEAVFTAYYRFIA